jgi:hypothetical protein
MDELMRYTTDPMALTVFCVGVMAIIWFARSLRDRSR